MAAPKTLKVQFDHERETKRTNRFAEVGDDEDQSVRTLYVQKDALADIGYTDGDGLEVTIKVRKG